MAIDTRDKRMSLIGMALTNRVFPHPDGSIDAGDRLQWLYLYRGIPAQGEGEDISYLHLLYRRRRGS